MAGTEEGPPPEGALRGPANHHHHMFALTTIYSNDQISAGNRGLCSVKKKASYNLSSPMGICLYSSRMVQTGRHGITPNKFMSLNKLHGENCDMESAVSATQQRACKWTSVLAQVLLLSSISPT